MERGLRGRRDCKSEQINNGEFSVGTEIKARVGWDAESPTFWLPCCILCIGSQLVTAGMKRSEEAFRRKG